MHFEENPLDSVLGIIHSGLDVFKNQ